jgi:hypothetical protein
MYTENNPELAKKETSERGNKIEGFFSVTKGTTILDARPRKRGWTEFIRRCGLSMLDHKTVTIIAITVVTVEIVVANIISSINVTISTLFSSYFVFFVLLRLSLFF